MQNTVAEREAARRTDEEFVRPHLSRVVSSTRNIQKARSGLSVKHCNYRYRRDRLGRSADALRLSGEDACFGLIGSAGYVHENRVVRAPSIDR